MLATSTLAMEAAVVSAALLGFRHGFDYDHVAAISDIAGAETDSRRAMKLGFTYALGHAATVAVLGLAVILFQRSLPASMDATMERATGVTLLILGVYVLWTTVYRPRAHHHGRVTILVNAALWAWWRLRRVFTPGAKRRQLFENGIGAAPAFSVGIIHGLGAETPTQLMLFLLAANLGGIAKGVLGLAMFIAGMLVMNTIMCAAAAGVFRVRPAARQWIAGFSAAYSIVLGMIFLAGTQSVAQVFGR